MISRPDSIWKMTTSALIGVVIGLIIFWFSGAAKSITRPEMVDYVQTNAPYIADKPYIKEALNDLKTGQADILKQIKEMRENQIRVLEKIHLTDTK